MGIEDDPEKVPERYERPLKYDFTNHAERNCVDFAARHGVSLDGSTAYLNWSPVPCPNCVLGFIQAGIKRIVGPKRPFAGKGNWDSLQNVSVPMLNEVNIEMVEITDYNFFVPLTTEQALEINY